MENITQIFPSFSWGLQIEIQSEWSNCFSINLLVVQNSISILFTDTSKTPRSGRYFVNKSTLLRYWLSITDYITTQVILAFWLVLAYDLLEDRRTTDVIITKFFPLCFKMAESFDNLSNILHDWAKDKVQESLVQALNRYQKHSIARRRKIKPFLF